MKERRSFFKRICWRKVKYTLGCNVPLACVFALFLFRLYHVVMLEVDLHRLRARGEPTTLAEVQRWVDQRPGEDGYPALKTFFKSMEVTSLYFEDDAANAFQADFIDDISEKGDLPAYDDDQTEYALYCRLVEKSYGDVYADLDKALGFPLYRVPIRYTDGFGVDLSFLDDFQEAFSQGKTIGIWQARDGRGEEALKTCSRLLGLADTLYQEPHDTAWLVRLVGVSRAQTVAAAILRENPENRDLLRRLEKRFAQEPDMVKHLQNAQMTERVMISNFINRSVIHEEDAALIGLSNYNSLSEFTLYWYLYRYFSTEADQRTFQEWIAQAQADLMSEDALRRRTAASNSSLDLPFYALLSDFFLPIQQKFILALLHIRAKHRLLLAAIDLRLDQLDGKPLPPIPGPLPGTVDPYSGQPLRIAKRTDGVIVLYSVGKDGKDSGGWQRCLLHTPFGSPPPDANLRSDDVIVLPLPPLP